MAYKSRSVIGLYFRARVCVGEGNLIPEVVLNCESLTVFAVMLTSLG